MKTFLTINLFLLFLSACSYDNAFSRFDISPKRAQSEESIVSSKIYNVKSVTGVMSCVYLNAVDSKKYNDGEYFYIYAYIKNSKEELQFTLNDINASSIQELESDNEFTLLTSSKIDWQKYYLVKFERQGISLAFVAKLSDSASDTIVFNKDN